MVLGGMPEVVQNYATYKDYKKAITIFEHLSTSYYDDIKYITNNIVEIQF